MPEPKKGELVMIRPLHQSVQASESAFGIFLGDEPRQVAWSTWWWQRLRDGDVAIVPAAPEVVEPAPKQRPPVRAPIAPLPHEEK